MVGEAHVPAGIDVHTPNVARMYDYFLCGDNNFTADREAAEKVLAIGGPEVRESARANRQFLGRTVRFLADAGIHQFLDIGAGLPTQNSVHEVVRHMIPDARVAYIDNDPVVFAHGQALLSGIEGVDVIQADLREPETILGRPDMRALIDFDVPVALLLVAILHFVSDDEEPAGIIAQFRDALAPGSYLVLSHDTCDARAQDEPRATAVCNRAHGPVMPRSSAQILRFFDGFELVEPGLVYVQEWGTGHVLTNPREMTIRGAVGCKI